MANYTRQMTKDVEIYKESKCFNGYTLFAPSFQNTTAWLIDMNGNVCHNWEMANPAGLNYHLLPSGNLIWMGRGKGVIEGLNAAATEIVEVDWDGNEVWRYDDNMVNHDFMVQENGNILAIRFVELSSDIQKKLKGGVPGTEINGKTYGNQIIEINRDKGIVWKWNSWEYFDPEKDHECSFCDRSIWGYMNAVDVFPNGDLVVSIRRMNKVARVSKKTGKIIWEWGQDKNLGHPHDVSVTDDGNITLFDNGLHRKIDNPGIDHIDTSCYTASRALEVNIKTNEIIWQYVDPMHLVSSNFMGSVQKLPNSNYLICNSASGTFYEVTKEKEVVWKYISPFVLKIKQSLDWTLSKLIFQAHRYGPDFEGLKGKDLNPEQYEWAIQKKTKESVKEEEKILERLSRAGY